MQIFDKAQLNVSANILEEYKKRLHTLCYKKKTDE